MDQLPSTVLEDPQYHVPIAPEAERGMAWLRAHVVRFCEGDAHDRRRRLVQRVLDEVGQPRFVDSPTRTLLLALGAAPELEADVALVSAAYQPHAAQSDAADAAADRLVDAFGGRCEDAAARVCVLVQSHGGTSGLAERLRAGSSEPPLPFTRRVDPDGAEVAVDLSDAHFGRGAHRCPGEALGRQLAQESVGSD